MCKEQRIHPGQEERRSKKGQRGLAHRRLHHLYWQTGCPSQEDRSRCTSSRQWHAWERALNDTVESYLRNSEQFHVGINELELFVLSPEDGAISNMSFAENACGEGGRKKPRGARNEARHRSGGDKTLLRGSARKPEQKLQAVAGSHCAHEREAEQAYGDMAANAKIDERSLGWNSEKVPPGRLGLGR